MAVKKDISKLGNVFSLGHGGDMFFDKMTDKQFANDEELLTVLWNKFVNPVGIEMSNDLWGLWGLEGDFKTFLKGRILELLSEINIHNSSAKLRAFKSLHYLPRAASVNLSVFRNVNEIKAPYFDDRMCKFICKTSEKLLKDRQIQIEYIKKRSPKVAKIVWQEKRPFNLFNHHLHRIPYNLPYRLVTKMIRVFNELIGKKNTQRNWEIQFLGKDNDKILQKKLFNLEGSKLIPISLMKKYYSRFKNNKNKKNSSHVVSMMLVINEFSNKNL